jgi:YVTN family beta-propeller protein
VTEPNTGNVSIIDTNTNTVIGTPIQIGDAPFDIAYDPIHKRMYVANFAYDTVSHKSLSTS